MIVYWNRKAKLPIFVANINTAVKQTSRRGYDIHPLSKINWRPVAYMVSNISLIHLDNNDMIRVING